MEWAFHLWATQKKWILCQGYSAAHSTNINKEKSQFDNLTKEIRKKCSVKETLPFQKILHESNLDH